MVKIMVKMWKKMEEMLLLEGAEKEKNATVQQEKMVNVLKSLRVNIK